LRGFAFFRGYSAPQTATKKDLPAAALSKPAVLPLVMPARPSYAAVVTGKIRLQKRTVKFVH
jgi:hypothetical protein